MLKYVTQIINLARSRVKVVVPIVLIIIILFLITIPKISRQNTFISPLSDSKTQKSNFLSDLFKTQLAFSFLKPQPVWQPKEAVLAANTSGPEITAKSAILIDLTSSKIIFKKNAHEKLPIASTAKIMTALVALERGLIDNTFIISDNAVKQPSHVMGLTAGERLTLKELLYGLLLPSGNDAAVSIAEGVAGSQTRFVGWMNQKVTDLGLSDSFFANASGLDEDNKNSYSSAYDLASITRQALVTYPIFKEIVGTTYHAIYYEADHHKAFILENGTPLVGKYPGVVGVKEGYTPDAGLTLVSLAKRDNKEMLVVILNADDRRGDAEKLIDYGFEMTKTIK